MYYLSFVDRKSRVKETQFPSTTPLPTVGTLERRQETYRAQASQCKFLPCKKKQIIKKAVQMVNVYRV